MATRLKQQGSSIRDTIQLLFSLLSECGVPKFPVECFRKAKFDKREAATHLWVLILHIMQLIQFLEEPKPDSSLVSADAGCFLEFSDAELREVSVTVREFLFNLGYSRLSFYTLHEVSSRELLLACAWLLNRSELFPKLAKHFLVAANRTGIPLKAIHQPIVEQLIDENRKMQSDVQGVILSLASRQGGATELSKSAETFHKLIWLKGCVDCKWKEVQQVHLAFQKLAYEIYQFTKSNKTSRAKQDAGLSVDEVFFLRYPNQMKAYLGKLDKCAKALELLVQWQQCEPLFWQWMESVVDLQEEAEERRQLEEEKEKEDSREKEGDKREGQGREIKGLCEKHKEKQTKKVKKDNRTNEDDEQMGEKGYTNCLEMNKEDLLVRWNTIQDEMKDLLGRNKLYMTRVNQVLEHKTRMLEQGHVNRQQQSLLKELQFRCPLVSQPEESTPTFVSSMLKELAPIDRPVFVAVGGCVAKAFHAFHASGQQHRAAGAEALSGTCAAERALTDRLVLLDAALEDCRSRVASSLVSMEKSLPPSLCKFDQVSN